MSVECRPTCAAIHLDTSSFASLNYIYYDCYGIYTLCCVAPLMVILVSLFIFFLTVARGVLTRHTEESKLDSPGLLHDLYFFIPKLQLYIFLEPDILCITNIIYVSFYKSQRSHVSALPSAFLVFELLSEEWSGSLLSLPGVLGFIDHHGLVQTCALKLMALLRLAPFLSYSKPPFCSLCLYCTYISFYL